MTLDMLIKTVEAILQDKKVVMDYRIHARLQDAVCPGLGDMNSLYGFLRTIQTADDPEISERNPLQP